ncbi:MAG: hypothetical protein J7K40_01355 [candidate division Zixibacteria bacterium]|nr:hypothetical protein [candidate division Zixibacteria bacterium]
MFLHSISGIQSSLKLMEKAALEAQKGPKGDITQSQVDMINAKHSLKANIAALRTADEMYRSLIDIFV